MPNRPWGIASLFHAHRMLMRRCDELEAERDRANSEARAWQELVLNLRQVPMPAALRASPKPVAATEQAPRQEGQPPKRTNVQPIRVTPGYAAIQAKNRARFAEEAARLAGGATEEERQEMRERMAKAADGYAADLGQETETG